MATSVWRRLPDQITIDHGPAALLGRFFLAADRAARDRGVHLSLRGEFGDLVALNAQERANWYPMLPLFDPGLSALRLDSAFWIEGRNAEGETVVAQAARLFRWPDTTLKRELDSKRMIYADPAADARPGESWRITAPSAARIQGRVLYSGSTWFRPDYRRRGLSRILPRISRAYGLTRWGTDYTISFIEAELIERGIVGSYGYRSIEPAVEGRATPLGDLDNALIWMDRRELVEDLRRFMGSLPASREPSDRQGIAKPAASIPCERSIQNGGLAQDRHAGDDATPIRAAPWQ